MQGSSPAPSSIEVYHPTSALVASTTSVVHVPPDLYEYISRLLVLS
jgi:hypothetical protein